MKKLFKIVLILIILIPVVKAQETAPAVEIFFETVNAPSSPIINCTLTARSQCWADTSGNSTPPGDYFLTDDYDNPVYTPTSNNLGSQSAGFEFITVTAGALGSGYPVFAYGLYKVTSNRTNKYFYLDYTDYRIGWYGLYSPPSYGHNIDLWIKYDDNDDSLTYSSGNPDSSHGILTGQLLNLWDIKQKGTQLTSEFPDYWENCLVETNNGENHPRLVWGPYPDAGSLIGTITGYRIYRSASHNAGQPPGSFSLLASVNEDVYEYVDNSVTMGGGYNAKSYYVTCVYEDPRERIKETSSTDTVEVRFQIPQKRGASNSNLIQNFKYNLKQNYPNPFNPVTTIEFTLKDNSIVTLKVFDILGREVMTIINEMLEAGIHQVEFDGRNLESGIYFYEIRTDKFRDVKKLILLK